MENTDKEEIRREVVESLKDEIRREVSTTILPLLENLEQLGITESPEPDKIEVEAVPPDRHVHMDFFPAFVFEGDQLRQIDLEQMIKRSEEEHHEHDEHDHEHDPGHEHKPASGQQRGKKKR